MQVQVRGYLTAMNYLFIHQNFPGQFRYLAAALSAAGHRVVALGAAISVGQLQGVEVLNYSPALKRRVSACKASGQLDEWQGKVIRGHAVVDALLEQKHQGFAPDVIFVHSGWGEALFVRSVFPDARLLVYAEYFYGSPNGDVGFDPEFSSVSTANDQRVILKNTHLLHALSACDAALSPTVFQKSRHPAWAQQKIEVIHDGIDTRVFRPDQSAWIQLQSAGVTLNAGDEVITFVARHLEPYRGYHIFMRALPLIQKLRPQARIVIVGGDGVSYGAAAPKGQTWKEIFLKEVSANLDMSRVHFVGKVPHHLLTRLMQVSAVHVYLTYPFVLSWSLLEAMSIGCLIVASDTAPVSEVIAHEKTGFLTDFFDARRLAETVADTLAGRDKLSHIGVAARQHVKDNFDLSSVCLPRLLEFVTNQGSQ